MTGSTTISIDANEFPVSSVVVFRTQAEVTRSFPIELQTGNNDLEIKGLPTTIQHDSLRIQGVGKGVTLLDHAISVKELRALKKAAEAELKVLSAQADILLGYSKSMTAEHVKPEDFMEYMAVFGKAGVQNVDATKQKEKDIEDIEAAIKKEVEASKTSSERNEHLRQTTISIVLSSETDLKAAELKITYVVNGASWTPTYEIRATTDANGQLNKTVNLHYKAAVRQNTGEDWKNTKLTLNTTSPTLARALLPHTGLKIRPGPTFGGLNGGFPTGAKNNQHAQLLALQQQRVAQQQAQQQMQLQQQTQMQMQMPMQQQSQQLQQKQAFAFGAASNSTNPFGGGGTGFGATRATSGGLFGAVPSSPQPAPVVVPASHSAPFAATGAPAGVVDNGGWTEVPHPSGPVGLIPSGPVVESVESASAAQDLLSNAAFNYADAVAESTAVSATYKIEGKTTILSGIATHKVVISTSTVLPIEVYVVTMPRVQPWACHQAKIKNTGAEPLLAGPVSIFNDESYVSSTQMPLVPPGESFICSLGMDDKVSVSFNHSDGNVVIHNVPFAGNTESLLAKNTIKVKNNRNGAISRLIIRDAIPVGQDPVKVLLKTPAELATVASVDTEVKIADGAVTRWGKDKPNNREEGLVEWVLDNIQSGEEKKVELAWSVEVPQGYKWSYTP